MPDRCHLYYITDRRAFGGGERERRDRLLKKIAEAADAGVDYIQLREKDLSSRELESLAREAVHALAGCKTALLINSRTDVALAVGADGVHLRSEDVPPKEVLAVWQRCGKGAPAREIATPALILSTSCHSPAETEAAAANGASLALFAPVFEKKDSPGRVAIGLAALREASSCEIPVLALGGVTLENAPACLRAGASGIAGIRLFQENDVWEIVKRLQHS
jgi:thiamine-phosphate pyrophosphorylase